MKIHDIASLFNRRLFVAFLNQKSLGWDLMDASGFIHLRQDSAVPCKGSLAPACARRRNGNERADQSCCFSYSDFCIPVNVEPKPYETTAVCAPLPRYRDGSC